MYGDLFLFIGIEARLDQAVRKRSSHNLGWRQHAEFRTYITELIKAVNRKFNKLAKADLKLEFPVSLMLCLRRMNHFDLLAHTLYVQVVPNSCNLIIYLESLVPFPI